MSENLIFWVQFFGLCKDDPLTLGNTESVPNGTSLRVVCMENHPKILTKTGFLRVITPIVPVTDLAEA
jgi:hypothetical protein